MKKTNHKLSSTLKKLIFLVSIFIIGIFILILVHLFFIDLLDKLDSKTKNLEAKTEIGNYIVNDIYKIRSDFYELSTSATNKRGKNIIKKRLEDRIALIKQALAVLEDGGELKRTTKLNIIGHHTTVKTTIYKRDSVNLPLEVINISPKLNELNKMLEKLMLYFKYQEKALKENRLQDYTKTTKQIKRFYKRTPAYFNRTTENTNRLLYEGE